ncbi:MAG: 50S ribosomal protein L35 [Clostridiales bacterium]|jgi:large subunit ribosomal protein L35|nr:50S ribosomal protein L35 [Clostridiales bacterium]
MSNVKIKLKTKKAVAKRFKITGTGKIKRFKSNKSHLLGFKTRKRKRNLRKSTLVSSSFVKQYKKMLGVS